MLLSIIIVNYKNVHLIINCVRSIVEYTKNISYEIIVVDNNSQDNSEDLLKEIFPSVKYIHLDYNSGFGRANNIGLKNAEGDFVLFMNSDIELMYDRTLNKLCADYVRISKSNKCIMGIRLVNPDNSYQQTIRTEYGGIKRLIKANPFFIAVFSRVLKIGDKNLKYRKLEKMHNASGFVKWINAALLVTEKRILIDNNLLFDEDFFLYSEDEEWSWRVNNCRIKFFHDADLCAIHIGSASTTSSLLKRAQLTVSSWLMYRKTRGKFAYNFYILVEKFNLYCDDYFYGRALKKNKKLSETEVAEKKYRDILRYLIKTYSTDIAFLNELSGVKSFKTNCYEDAFLQKQ